MSTRSLTMVVDRSAAEDNELGFACNPSIISDKSYVNMYLHHDGYPEYHGVQLSNWVNYMQKDQGFNNFGDASRIASHLVYDFHYNSQYLYPDVDGIDHAYTYIIWTGKSDVWISCYSQYGSKNIFVLPVDKIIKQDISAFEYTDWNYKANTNQK